MMCMKMWEGDEKETLKFCSLIEQSFLKTVFLKGEYEEKA